ncbi:TPA: hypothetical protein I7778_18395, partial [Vibrio vulnificus]|nr:hypothetical protein [Vibrio vulnificus]
MRNKLPLTLIALSVSSQSFALSELPPSMRPEKGTGGGTLNKDQMCQYAICSSFGYGNNSDKGVRNPGLLPIGTELIYPTDDSIFVEFALKNVSPTDPIYILVNGMEMAEILAKKELGLPWDVYIRCEGDCPSTPNKSDEAEDSGDKSDADDKSD